MPFGGASSAKSGRPDKTSLLSARRERSKGRYLFEPKPRLETRAQNRYRRCPHGDSSSASHGLSNAGFSSAKSSGLRPSGYPRSERCLICPSAFLRLRHFGEVPAPVSISLEIGSAIRRYTRSSTDPSPIVNIIRRRRPPARRGPSTVAVEPSRMEITFHWTRGTLSSMGRNSTTRGARMAHVPSATRLGLKRQPASNCPVASSEASRCLSNGGTKGNDPKGPQSRSFHSASSSCAIRSLDEVCTTDVGRVAGRRSVATT